MAHLRDQDGHARAIPREADAPVQSQWLSDFTRERIMNLAAWDDKVVQVPFNPNEELIRAAIDMLVELQQVPVMVVKPLSDRRDQSSSVRALRDQYGTGVRQSYALLRSTLRLRLLLPIPPQSGRVGECVRR